MDTAEITLGRLYADAFSRFGASCLWSKTPVRHPTAQHAKVIAEALGSRVAPQPTPWPERSTRPAMPLTPLQHKLLGILADNRTPKSYVAGGAVLNADTLAARYSADIDLFSDRVEALANSVEADTTSLSKAGIGISWQARSDTFHRAVVSDAAKSTRLDWAVDSDYRFYPAQRDERFGFALHPVDLATNKLLAAEGRNEVRDAIDLMTAASRILPLGANAWAAAAKSPGTTPFGIIEGLRARARFTDAHLSQERLARPLSAADLNLSIRSACDEAGAWLRTVPSRFEFGLFVSTTGEPGVPDFATTGDSGWRIHGGSRGGVWPSSSEISGEMLRDAADDR